MSDRLTAAGEALVNDPEAGHEETCDIWRQRGCDCGFRYAVAAIEAEAAARAVDEALSVERMSVEIDRHWLVSDTANEVSCTCGEWSLTHAEALAVNIGDHLLQFSQHCAAALVAHLRGPR